MVARRMLGGPGGALAALLLLSPIATAQTSTAVSAPGVESETEARYAPVTLDGHRLFRVYGFSGYPAAQRAQKISERIVAVADDSAVSPDSLAVIDEGDVSRIVAGDQPLVIVFDAQAKAEGVSRQRLAEAIRTRIVEGIRGYRRDRDPQLLLVHAGYALVGTLAAILLFLGLWGARHWLTAVLERRLRASIEGLAGHGRRLAQVKQVWTALRSLCTALYVVLIFVLAYLWLSLVLNLFPWTRPLAQRLVETFIDPLRTMALSFLGMIPDLVFLTILVLVARYLLKFLKFLFQSVERGAVSITNFEPEWAMPTYKIVRLLLVILVLVVAYPYIPGSRSAAFRGLTLFLGVIFSLSSSNVIANLIAGYTMIYRRAFRTGDCIEVGNVLGDVTQTRLLVTHMRTPKNEDVVLPNSLILNSNVLNYSTQAKSGGLILHTTVGIGYETPWRQVEEMLKLAADRTPGLLRTPKAFVLLKSLDNFAVRYEINVYTGDPQGVAQAEQYAALHRNILDVFNEYGVQIMTPAYLADTESPKIVPKERWYSAPAVQCDDVHPTKPDSR